MTRALTLSQQADAVWTHLGGNPMQPYTDCVALLDSLRHRRHAFTGRTAANGAYAARAVRIVQNRLRTAQ